MSRIASRVAIAAASLLAACGIAGAALAQSTSSTIRIEPRPYYGATVTVEQGVRVWRPLPVTKYMIINPGGRTPVNVNVTDVNDNLTGYNPGAGGGYGAPAGAGAPAYGDTYAVPGGFGYGYGYGFGHRGRGFRGGAVPHHRGGGIGFRGR